MAKLDIDFEWHRDPKGYERLDAKAERPGETLLGGVPAIPRRIVRRGGQLKSYRPMEAFENLCIQFADIKDESAALGFIEKFGPLTSAGMDVGKGEEIPLILKHAQAMKGFLEGKKLPLPEIEISSARVVISTDKSTKKPRPSSI